MTWTPAAGELIDERFLLERELARGSMGQVWIAEHVTLACPCAVKFIDERYVGSAFLRDRFKREAQAAARLRSRHVVQILDFGVWRGVPYIAMELLEGETLAERLDRRGRLTPQETMSLMQGVARALGKAGALGIVHRDLKPENVFIVRDGVHEYAKVLDFGVAKLRDTALMDSGGDTKPGVHVGTPYYMSPEQADGAAPVDHRSDLWAFAVIVYECLTGEVPFYEEGLGRLLMQIMAAPIPVPSEIDPELPPRFDDWWHRAACRDPDGRFQDAEGAFESLFDALIDLEDSLSSWPALAARKTSMFPPGLRSLSGSSAPPPDTLPPVSDFPALVGPFPSARPPTSDPPLYSSRPPAAASESSSSEPAPGAAALDDRSRRRRGLPMPWVVAAVAVALFVGAWGSRQWSGGAGFDEQAAPAAQPIDVATEAQAAGTTAANTTGANTTGANTTGADTTAPDVTAPDPSAPSDEASAGEPEATPPSATPSASSSGSAPPPPRYVHPQLPPAPAAPSIFLPSDI